MSTSHIRSGGNRAKSLAGLRARVTQHWGATLGSTVGPVYPSGKCFLMYFSLSACPPRHNGKVRRVEFKGCAAALGKQARMLSGRKAEAHLRERIHVALRWICQRLANPKPQNLRRLRGEFTCIGVASKAVEINVRVCGGEGEGPCKQRHGDPPSIVFGGTLSSAEIAGSE